MQEHLKVIKRRLRMLSKRSSAFFLLILLGLSFSSWATCLDRKMKVDTNCQCQKTKTCYKLKNKKYKKSLKKLAAVITAKRAKKIHSMRSDVAKEMQNVFSGKFVYDPKKIKEFQKRTAKISKYNKKLTKKVEKLISKKYGKKFNIEKRKKKLRSKLSMAIPKKLKEKVEKKGMSFSIINGLVSGQSINLANINYEKIPEQNLSSITKGLLKESEKPKSIGLKNTSDPIYKLSKSDKEKTKKIMGRKFRSKHIHGPDVSLFGLISKRYQASYGILDKGVITAATFGSSTDKVKKERRQILSKLGL